MKAVCIVGIVWVGICFILLWLNHRFHRHCVSSSEWQNLVPRTPVETKNRKGVTQLTSEDDAIIVSTNLSLSPRTGKITSPSGEVKLELYRRPKTAKTIKKTEPGRDIGQEPVDRE